jgi:transposase
MLHEDAPKTYIRQSHITKITCPRCRGSAYLVRRSLEPELKNETRTFECNRCGSRTDINFHN